MNPDDMHDTRSEVLQAQLMFNVLMCVIMCVTMTRFRHTETKVMNRCCHLLFLLTVSLMTLSKKTSLWAKKSNTKY